MPRRSALVLAALALALPLRAAAAPLVGGPPVPAPVGEALGVCDPLDPAHCLLPFPSDVFTVVDPATDTGRRIAFSPLALPTNLAGKPWDPSAWNGNDGFSPGTPILARVPGLDLRRTWGMATDQLSDLGRSLRADAPIVLLDAETGERHPFWSELDTHPDTPDDRRALIVRPAENLAEGHRYVVALRRLRDRDGRIIPAGPAFAALRDGRPAPSGAVEARRTATGRVLAELDRAGIGRGDLYLAWDFTVASERNLTERVLRMRDDAFAKLGDTRLGDGVVQGVAPHVTVTAVEDRADDGPTRRVVEGTISVPNYLTPQVRDELSVPAEARDGLEPIEDAAPSPADSVVGLATGESLPVSAPGSRLNLGRDGLPVQNPLQPTVEVEFECHLPRRAAVPHGDGAADTLVYGHGLLGGRGEVGGSSTEDLRRRGFATCAMDWWGMSTADLPNVVSMLADFSSFPSLPDRAQQGFVNMLHLARSLAHPQGFAALPAFRDGGGPLIRTGRTHYAGNSQGAIMGGALVALSPDLTRGMLGVPGMNYSTLLNRSVDWEGAYAVPAYVNYPDAIDQQLVFALVQMLWDRGESNGYAHHMTSDPVRDTPRHQVMLQVAYSDHQVANVAAEVMARTVGADLKWPALGAASPHWSVDPLFGMGRAPFGAASRGRSVLVYWYSADRQNRVPPNGNVPPRTGGDPHGDPRKDGAGSDQVAHFLRTGELIDVCAGGPCVTTDASRKR